MRKMTSNVFRHGALEADVVFVIDPLKLRPLRLLGRHLPLGQGTSFGYASNSTAVSGAAMRTRGTTPRPKCISYYTRVTRIFTLGYRGCRNVSYCLPMHQTRRRIASSGTIPTSSNENRKSARRGRKPSAVTAVKRRGSRWHKTPRTARMQRHPPCRTFID